MPALGLIVVSLEHRVTYRRVHEASISSDFGNLHTLLNNPLRHSTVSFYLVFRRATIMATGVKRKAVDLAAADAKKPKANGSITSFFGAPKPVSTSSSTSPVAPPPAVKFDKDAWLAKLTDEQKELLKLEIETLHESWLAHLKDEVVTKEFLDLKRFLRKEKEDGKTIFPPLEDVYSWWVLLRHA